LAVPVDPDVATTTAVPARTGFSGAMAARSSAARGSVADNGKTAGPPSRAAASAVTMAELSTGVSNTIEIVGHRT
jgi:hypothetical protein